MMRTVGLVVGLTLASGAAAADWPEIVLEERLSGFNQPVGITHAGDGSGRLWAYASIIDLLSRDPTTIFLQKAR